jgi:hypothetical protein
MDEIEGGTLVINKGDERKPKESASGDPDERNLNTVDGLAEGWKLAEVRQRVRGPSKEILTTGKAGGPRGADHQVIQARG